MPGCSVSRWLFVANLGGIKHAGIGTDPDLSGYHALPAGIHARLRASYKPGYGLRDKIDIKVLDHPKKMYDITQGLTRRNYSDIRAAHGKNFRRAFGEIRVS